MKGDSFASKMPSFYYMAFRASTRLRPFFRNYRTENFKNLQNECVMQFSFGELDDLEDTRNHRFSLNLENRLLYLIYRRHFFDRLSFQQTGSFFL